MKPTSTRNVKCEKKCYRNESGQHLRICPQS